MSVDRVVDLLAARLTAAAGGPRVDDVAPAATGDLPCATVSLADVHAPLAGVGRVPRGTRVGALPLTAVVDLADPVLELGGGERLTMLSDDRRTLTLPHGPLVAADGTEGGGLGPGDVSADDGSPYEVVTGSPTGRQVRADAVEGTLRFGAALPATGALTVGYAVGRWDVVVSRALGELVVDVTASTAGEVRALARRIAAALEGGLSDEATAVRAEPAAWGAVTPSALGETAVRTQRLRFRLDAEVVDPVLSTSGGVITRVAVTGALAPAAAGAAPEPFEPFDVQRGAPT